MRANQEHLECYIDRVALIKETTGPCLASVADLFPDEPIVACDFSFRDIARAELRPYGYEFERIQNVDHHGPDSVWERFVSSGNLACLFVQEKGIAPLAVVNHTDCDSILSAGIVTGKLEPKAMYEEAVIAADHTGEENHIADLLQSIQDERSLRFSFDCLERLERGKPLDRKAIEWMDIRKRNREAAVAVLPSAVKIGELCCLELESKIESELLGALVSDSWAVAMAFPCRELPGRTELKMRLTKAAPAGFTLRLIDMAAVDPAYGGRWNAGSNRRGGASSESPAEILERVSAEFTCAVERFLVKMLRRQNSIPGRFPKEAARRSRGNQRLALTVPSK
ncbi:MAG: hypothetical protein KF812_02650 [Fimbriimonadaceae bacterium]|nr:hypothetical protein [Fimbriimonadaceae bacterium]